MRTLITGGTGFVGQYLCRSLLSDGAEVFTFSIDPPPSGMGARYEHIQGDLRDEKVVEDLLADLKPAHVYHLAAISAVPVSWQKPRLTFDLNVWGTYNLLQASARLTTCPRVLNVSTGAVYAACDEILTESSPLQPANPYAASKAMAELVRFQFPRLPVITTRSFNHSGPGQTTDFVLPALAKQVADIQSGSVPAIIHVGALDVERDFLHVADVISAYRLLIDQGRPGEVYNVSSGEPRKLTEALERLCGIAGVRPEIRTDSTKIRAEQVRRIFADSEKLRQHTGWRPQKSWNDLLHDLLEYWRHQHSLPAASRGSSAPR
jgi:GDP-4-dehydro-6-deoxy-D-mannose reductase